MQLIKIMRSGNYYLLKFANGATYKVSEEVIIKFHLLKPNIEVDDLLLAKIIKENIRYELLNKMIKYQMTLHSKKEVLEHFSLKYEKEDVKSLILKLDELGLNNDYLYAKNVVLNSSKKGIGIKKISLLLKDKGINNEIISEVLGEYDYNAEKEACLNVATKYLATLKNEASSIKRHKLINFLQYRGFSDMSLSFVLEKKTILLDNKEKDEALLKAEINKLIALYRNKMDSFKLKNKIIRSLNNKGYSINEILKIYESRDEND